MAEGDAKSLSKERYGQLATGYVSSAAHSKGPDLDRLVEMASPREDWLALDVATGGGHTALKFAPWVKQVVATDIAAPMLEAARAFIGGRGVRNILFGIADAEHLPFAGGAFDVVTCRIAAHHFPDPARFVREGRRVLKEGGLLLVQDHVLPEEEGAARYVDAFERLRDPSHNRAYAKGEWIGLLRMAGLQVTGVEQIVKRHRFVPWTERQRCSSEVVRRLVRMMEDAPPGVVAWMEPRDFGTPGATFANRHILIVGGKS